MSEYSHSTPISRRRLLTTVAATGVTACAGCSGGSSGDQAGTTAQSQTGAGTRSNGDGSGQTGADAQSGGEGQAADSVDPSATYRWASFWGGPGAQRATPLETPTSELTLGGDPGYGGGYAFGARKVTGFVATADWFAIGDSRAREVVSYPVPDANTPPEERVPTAERWSASRLGPRYLTLHNGQLHVSGNPTHRQLDPETGEVVNEFEPPSLFDDNNETVVFVDDQHAYVDTGSGLGAVDYTTNSVVWTSPDLEHPIGWAIRAGEYIVVISSTYHGSQGITTLSADSGERVASVAPQSGRPTGLGRISSGAAGTFGYRTNTDRNVKSLVRVDPTDLSVMWEAPEIEIGAEEPFVSVGTDVVLLDTTEKGLAAVDAEDGSLRWSARGNFINHGLSANAAYGWANNSLLVFDIETGELITETESGVNGTQIFSVAPAPTGVFVVTNEGANFFAPA